MKTAQKYNCYVCHKERNFISNHAKLNILIGYTPRDFFFFNNRRKIESKAEPGIFRK